MNIRLMGVLIAMAAAWSGKAATVTLTNPDAFGATSFNSGLNWSDGQAPSGTNDYVVVTLVPTNPMAVRTPAVAANFVFAGNSLTLGNGTTNGQLTFKGNGGSDIITITNLTLNIGVVANGQTATNPLTLAGDITLGAGGGVFDMGGAGRSITVNAPIGGAGNLTAANVAANGAGTVILGANNTYLGTTMIATGTLQVGTGGTTGSLGAGNVTNRGTLVFNRSDSYTVANNISGNTGNLLVRNGNMTLLNAGTTNNLLTVADAAGPVTSAVLNISNSAVVIANATLGNCNIGQMNNTSSTGTVNMSSGLFQPACELWIAAGSGNSRGIFNLSGGTVIASTWGCVGRGSATGLFGSYGELNVSGGAWSNVTANNITIASFAGNTGVVRVTGGRLYSQLGTWVGESGVGSLNVGGTGVVDVNTLSLGQANAGVGTLIVSGGVVQARTSIVVANAAGNIGTMKVGAGQILANVISKTGTANINLSGGQLCPYNANAAWSAPMALTTDASYGGNGVVIFNARTAAGAAADITVSGSLSGDGSLVKMGPGALNLNAANSYNGTTTIGEGYSFGTGSVVSATTVSNGAFLGPNSLLQSGMFTINASVTLENGAGISALLDPLKASLFVSGTLTAGGNNPVNLLPTSVGVTPGIYTICLCPSIPSFNFTTGTIPAGVQGYLNNNVGAQTIEFVVTNVTGGLVWSGLSNNNWDVNTTTNFIVVGLATPSAFNNGDAVGFDDTGTNTAVTIVSAIMSGQMFFSNNAATYSLSGAAINGYGGITKSGTNAVGINTANGYTGTNFIFGGTLAAGNAAALGATSGPTIINGGTLDVGGQNLGLEPIFVSGAGAGGNGAIINSGAAQINALQYVTLQDNAAIGGTNRWDIRAGTAPFLNLNGFQITKTGTNFIGLVGATVTNTGDIIINQGLISPHNGAIVSGSGMITVNSGGIFAPTTFGAAPTVTKAITLNGGTLQLWTGGGAALSVGSPVTLNAGVTNTIDTPDQALTLTNVISGAGGFTKTSANQLLLIATNTYAGATIIGAGSISVGNGGANGTLGAGNVTNNSQLIFNRSDSYAVTNNIAGTGGTLIRKGNMTLLNTSAIGTQLIVMDAAAPAGITTLNISNSSVVVISSASGNCNIGVPSGGLATGIVNMTGGYFQSGGELWIAAGANYSRGIFNLSGGNVSVSNWTAVGRGLQNTNNAYGELNISGGSWSNIALNNITIGSFLGNTGRVTITGGRIYAQNSFYIAEGGVASMNVSGGTVEPNVLTMCQGAGGVGRLDISGGTVTSRTTVLAGNAANTIATIVQTGGTFAAGTAMTLGNAAGSSVTLTQAGGTITVGTALTLGNAASAVGTIYQSGGSVTVSGGDSRLAQGATNSYGYYQISGGTVALGQNYQVGATGVGIMAVSGTGAVSANAGYPVVGRFIGGRGVLDVSGGAFTHNNAGTFLIIGEQGLGILNASGSGTVTVHAARTGDGLRIGHNLGTGIVNIATGGTIIAPAVSRTVVAGNIGTLNFNGGTLKANTNNIAFMPNLSAVNIYSGGATIDDGGFAITIAQPLLAPAGGGVVSIPVANSGSGYKGPPWIQIAGGGGSNATAIAQMNLAAGTLTNILVTCAGTGYTDAPTVSLFGGGATNAAAGTNIIVSASSSGGLTKLGAGTLTLTAANTYSGATTISNGTLALSAGGALDSSMSIFIGSNATLSAVGRTNGTFTISASQALAGYGTILGNVINNGIISPGSSAGHLAITGNYAQAGALNIEIGGATPGVEYDQLEISGAAGLGGNLNVTLINGYAPSTNDIFFVLKTGAGLTGNFAATGLCALAGGYGWNVDSSGGFVKLTIVNTNATATGYDLWAAGITNGRTAYNQFATTDGYPNLLKYATGSSASNSDLLARMESTQTNGLFALKFKHSTTATDITIYVEGSYNVTNEAWAGIATNINGSWGATTNVSEDTSSAPATDVVWDTAATATNRFLRLRVTRP